MNCPQCQFDEVLLSHKRQVNHCGDCGHEWTMEEPFSPLRIFLSYGHDSSEELVRRIKADLEKRGHDFWFDKSEIKFGDDWRRSITDGIASSQKFVAFLSKHSNRDPSVCREEIAMDLGVKGGKYSDRSRRRRLEPRPSQGNLGTQRKHKKAPDKEMK